MSKWTHAICKKCWKLHHPDRNPACILDDKLMKCCYCGQMTDAGIYVRDEPAKCLVNGVHPDDQ